MEPVGNAIDSLSNYRHSRSLSTVERSSRGASFNDALRSAVNESDGQTDTRGRRPVDTRLMDTCIEMESLLVSNMLKAMRRTVPKNEWLHGGNAEEIFQDMLYDEYALKMSRTANLGLATMLYNQMSGTRG